MTNNSMNLYKWLLLIFFSSLILFTIFDLGNFSKYRDGIESTVLVCGLLLTWIGLFQTWERSAVDSRKRESDSYLLEIKNCLSSAIALLSKADNSNITWHQAIYNLKTADSLLVNLTEAPHKHICLNEYTDAAYYIVSIINKINDFKFFYGIPDYQNQTPQDLYSQSTLPPYLRIDPKALIVLLAFIGKVNQGMDDIANTIKSPIQVFDSEYFKKPINEATTFNKLSNIPIIDEYIKDFYKRTS